MLRLIGILALAIALGCYVVPASAQRDVPVPASCTPQVNQRLSGVWIRVNEALSTM